MADKRPLLYRYLGRRSYKPTWDLQRALARGLQHGEQTDPSVSKVKTASDVLLAVEHDPVITIGRRGKAGDILLSNQELARRGVEVHKVDRGGEVTLHGPGQLVVYPIVRVDPRRFGVGDLVRGLAAEIAGLLGQLGIEARYDPDNPGLWVADAKICSVGMRVSRGVSTHGAALNVSNDVDAFRWIVPCGTPNVRVTNVAELSQGRAVPPLDELAMQLADRFAHRFGFEQVSLSDSDWRKYVGYHTDTDLPLS